MRGVWMLALLWLAVAEGIQAAPRLEGPFRADSLAFFIVHHGGPLLVELHVNRPTRELKDQGGVRFPHAVFWQLYDADERLAARDYHRFTGEETGKVFRVQLPDAPAGVYQLRYAKSPANEITVDLRCEPPASFGVMPCRARLHEGRKNQFRSAWVYVPPGEHRVRLNAYAATLRLLGRDGRPMARAPGELRVRGEALYRVEATFDHAASAVGISGVPPILCPDEATARRIGGSVERAPDGRLLAHRFQVRMWEWMHRLTPADLAAVPKPLLPLESFWLQDPRNAGLLGPGGPFNHVPRILRDQNLDPNSEDYGLGTNTSWLGPVYAIDAPFNPYRRDRAILNRLLLQEFARFLSLSENGTFVADDWNDYSGTDGLSYGERAYLFGSVAPLIDPDLRQLWFDGVSRLPHRWAFDRVSCENQTASFMLIQWMLGQGSGDDLYRTLAADFAAAFYDPHLNSFMKTGYHQERYG
ncbi:MAG: hypothetical protein QHJ73_18720, partial [Armatimonadota bacterium]|nr:hypothetical protein [Armatimonadota bacterium]